MREAISACLEQAAGLRLVASVGTALEAEVMVLRLRPRLLLVQGALLANGNADAVYRLRANCPETRILILGGIGLDSEALTDLQHVPYRWIPDDVTPEQLPGIVLDAASNGSNRAHSGGEPPSDPGSLSPMADEVLTPAELRVLRLTAAGLSNREIAERLVVSHYTVRNHVRNILTKLKVKNRTAASALLHATILERALTPASTADHHPLSLSGRSSRPVTELARLLPE